MGILGLRFARCYDALADVFKGNHKKMAVEFQSYFGHFWFTA